MEKKIVKNGVDVTTLSMVAIVGCHCSNKKKSNNSVTNIVGGGGGGGKPRVWVGGGIP